MTVRGLAIDMICKCDKMTNQNWCDMLFRNAMKAILGCWGLSIRSQCRNSDRVPRMTLCPHVGIIQTLTP
jgi:hypothetical protein